MQNPTPDQGHLHIVRDQANSNQTPNEQNLLKANAKYAKHFHDGHLSHIPAKKYAIVTCMDCRIDPAAAFGIKNGDAHVIRNAGGSARDALRSLVISEQLLQTTEVFVIKHTHCGMMGITNEQINATVEKNLGAAALAELNGLDWLPFQNLEQGVKDDVAFLEASKAIPDSVHVSGWVYDVENGMVGPVKK
ncbi:MAG: hypothetical protein LQ345_005205 [Seirophora villosa]|nr:MAG: hypothetical protein LQ345_005205 [Seirophora villosa]